VVGKILKKREKVKLWLFTPSFRGKAFVQISQIENSKNIWFIFTTSEFKTLGFDKSKTYLVFFNDGESIFKLKFRQYKYYYAFWLNALYLPRQIYSITFEVMEDGKN